MTLKDLDGSKWAGTGELWLDPLGNEADRCDVTAAFEGDTFAYEWAYEGQPQNGTFVFDETTVGWSDTFHQKEPAQCRVVPNKRGLITLEHDYSAPGYGEWGWRTIFSARPDGSLVIHMTNITSWGEEGRAVRWTLQRT